MALTVAERKAAERARRREQGLEEVRGIWAPAALHEDIKKAAVRKGATVGPPKTPKAAD